MSSSWDAPTEDTPDVEQFKPKTKLVDDSTTEFTG